MPEQRYRVLGLDCADCAREVEQALRDLPGLTQVYLDFASGLLHLEGEAIPTQTVTKRVQALGYRLESVSASAPLQAQRLSFWAYLWAERETRLTLIGALMLGLGFLTMLWSALRPLTLVFQVGALLLAGFPLARHAWNGWRYSRELGINALMTLAAIGAVAIGEITEAATLVILFALAEALEGYTTERTRRTLDSLRALLPEEATRLTPHGEERVTVAQLQMGDRLRIRPDERIPVDGRVLAGSSEVNQAPITGESLPVEKHPGDEVFAGSINGRGSLEIEVTRPAHESALQRILDGVLAAQAQRPPFQRFVDRFARYYTPAVVALAVLVAVLPPVLFGQPFLNPPEGGRGWLYRGLALLVIACPCALVMSTPITYFSALTAAARRGILVKGGTHLEALHQVRAVAFDKTGTLTLGQPQLTRARAVDCAGGERCPRCDDLLALAEAMERETRHPLARAVLQAAADRGLEGRYPLPQSVAVLPGMGLKARFNGHEAALGNHRWFDDVHPHPETLCREIGALEDQGQTTVLLQYGGEVRGYLAFMDIPRPESRATVTWLQQHGRRTALLSGDQRVAAQTIGKGLGVDEVYAPLLPTEKMEVLRDLQRRFGAVAMVGDGVNDTPALAMAQVGIAVGGAHSAQAMETADVVLMNDTLKPLPFLFRLADLTHRLVRQNVAFSLVTKFTFVILAALGQATLWMAVLADMGVSLLVAFNGMRPLGLSGHTGNVD
jgi:Cd2+/Zn2+-exporting ATPase